NRIKGLLGFIRTVDEAKQSSRLPILRDEAGAHVRGPGNVAAVRKLCQRGPSERYGAVLSAARIRLREMLPGAAARVCGARAYLQRLRILFVVFGFMAGACQKIYRADGRAVRNQWAEL